MKHFTVTTTRGVRWAEQADSPEELASQFWGLKIGLQIEKIEEERLFTPEEEVELRREKIAGIDGSGGLGRTD